MSTNPTQIGDLDRCLDLLCEAIQLTETQFNTAVNRYEAVGRWLTEADTSLDKLSPEVFPQGSMRLRTTVRPVRKQDEVVPFDLDAVCCCAVDPTRKSSQALYSQIESHLRSNANLQGRLSAEPKCLRLDYASDDFYLDIVPACIDPTDPEKIRLLIPDRARWSASAAPIDTWRRTDPLRYARWFDTQCATTTRSAELAVTASVSRVPPREPASIKAPLRRAVQLLKRQRDVEFLGRDSQPSSILLTTLAGRCYQGEVSLSAALATILDRICALISQAQGRRISVPNPAEPTEDLVKPLTDETYRRFKAMMVSMRQRLDRLRHPRTPTDFGSALVELAGTRVAGQVSARLQADLREASSQGKLAVAAGVPSLQIVKEVKPTPGVHSTPPNTFHG
ncbi:MAG: nucleotidyltransferase [Phycisphaerales bacterium]|nr:nucleotidyltransferase [Phycisphaerales bacterium]